MKQKICQVSMILSCVFMFQLCQIENEPAFDNPNDPLNPDFQMPGVVILSPSNNDQILSSDVTFNWQGVHNGSSFSYKLDGIDSDFGEWTTATSVTYNYLDEGSYTFYIKEKVGSYEQTVLTNCHININALRNPSLVFNRWYTHVTANQENSVDIDFENISNFKGISAQVSFSSNITINRVEKIGDALENDGANLVLLTNTTEEMNELRMIQMDGVLLGGNSDGFTGNAPVCRIYFTASGNGQFEFISNSVSLRDFQNQEMATPIFRGGQILIQ